MSKRSHYKKYYLENYTENLPESTKYLKKAKKLRTSGSSSSSTSDENVDEVHFVKSDISLHSDITDTSLDATTVTNEECDKQILDIVYSKAMYATCSDTSKEYEANDSPTEIDSDSSTCIDSSARNMIDYTCNLSYEDDSYCSFDEDSDCVEDFTYSSIPNMPSSLQSYVESIKADNSNEIIKAKFIVSKEEVLLGMLKIGMEFFLPCSGIASLFQCFNSFFDEQIIPDTRYFIDKLFNSHENIEYHAICPTCQLYVGKFEWKERTKFCTMCNKNINVKDPSYNDYFVILDIEHELSNLIETNAEYYDDIVCNTRVPNVFQDIYDGLKYKQFLSSLSEDEKNYYVTCTFNTDGSPVFKSSKFSVWPIQININEIPVHERSKKPITYGLWFGKKKPNMSIFLSTFVDNMNRYSEKGITCNVNGEKRNLKLYGLCCCVDSPARAQMQGFIQYNGYYGCGWCLHRGEAVKHIVRSTIKYPLLEENVQLRTETDTIKLMEQAVETGSVACGVKEASPLINLNKFNIIDGFVPDQMHSVSLGVAKQISEYWIYGKKKPYSLSKSNLNRIDDIVKSFKVPNQLCRLSRSIKDCRYWKAKEWENWLLYYSCPSLKEIENFDKYFQHWQLLVQAIHILLRNSITIESIHEAHELLKKFMYYCELYYSKDSMTYNVHQLLHLSQSVINWGSLWSHFGYPFESGNGYIVKTVQAGKGVIGQICRYLNMKQCVTALQQNIMYKKRDSPVIKFCNNIHRNCTKKTVKFDTVRYFGRPISIEPALMDSLCLSQNSRGYRKIVKNKCIYKSKSMSCNRSNNSFAVTEHGQYILIDKFVIDSDNLKEYVIYQNIIVQNTFSSLDDIKKIERIEEDLNLIEIKSLCKICVYMKVNDIEYLSAVPNMYWFN